MAMEWHASDEVAMKAILVLDRMDSGKRRVGVINSCDKGFLEMADLPGLNIIESAQDVS